MDSFVLSAIIKIIEQHKTDWETMQQIKNLLWAHELYDETEPD